MTELRSNQFQADHPSSYYAKYIAKAPLTVEEMKAFIGCRLYIEHSVHKKSYASYWKADGKHFVIETPGFIKVFERDRFLAIWSFLHTVDEADVNLDKTDKIYKNRKVLNDLCVKFRNYYTPHRFLSLDEGMIPCKNRLSIKQYLKDKPVKWGLKSFLLCDSENGYISAVEIYTGKENELYPELKATGNVVVRLLTSAGLQGKGHCLVMDRFYSSVILSEHLHSVQKTYTVGTIMSNRKFFPKQIIKKKLPNRGDCDFMCLENLTCFIWMDKRVIYFVSNFHDPAEMTTVLRKDKTGTTFPVPTPQAVKDYNLYMGGCDHNDQMTRLHRTRKHYKWPRRLFMKILMWAVFNSYVLYKASREGQDTRTLSFSHYVDEVCSLLIGGFRSSHVRKARHSDEAERRLINVGLHHPQFKEDATKGHRCVVCSKKYEYFKKRNPNIPDKDIPLSRSKSCIQCSECEAYLCVKRGSSCWKDYHFKKEYWR